MKINGHICQGPKPEVIVIPKNSTKYIFKARTVSTSEYSEFYKLCPEPNPPSVRTKDGVKNDVDDSEYQKELQEWVQTKSHFIVLKSLSATEGIEWDNVDMNKPSTWGNWGDDLLKAGFLEPEISLILNTVYEAQGMNASKIEAATKSFLAEQGANL